jgi:carboxyl-terminal processing protease
MKIQITRKQILNLVALVVICAAWFAIGWVVRGRLSNPEVALVEQVRYKLLREHPGDIPSSRELTYAAIRGMLNRIDDPYAALFEPEVSARFAIDQAGRSGVIGVSFEDRNGEMAINQVNPGQPAEQAGLLPGDVILAVDGVDIDPETTSAELSLLLRGPAGSSAHLVVRRGEETLTFDPVRQARTIVSSRMLPGDIAYVAQTAFTTNAAELMRDALKELLARHPKGLIWDLRANGGGSMDTTQDVLSFFIEDGLLFSAEQKGGKEKLFTAHGDAVAADVPMVVLIDEATYSAGETAAAAVKERGRGTLIGSTTYGKGIIIANVPLVENCILRMTIAKWLSPQGHWYDEQGVPPNIPMVDDGATDPDEVLQFAREYLLQNAGP